MAVTTFHNPQLITCVKEMVAVAQGYPSLSTTYAGGGIHVPGDTNNYADATWNGVDTGTYIADGVTLPWTPPAGAVDYSAINPANTTIPTSYFCTHFLHQQDQSIPTPYPTGATFGMNRLSGPKVNWDTIATARGVYDWSSVDAQLTFAQAHGMGLLFVLSYTPQWAQSFTGRPVGGSHSGTGSTSPPANWQDLRDFLTALVNRYGTSIAAIDVFNEPDDPAQWSGSVADLVTWTQTVYQTVKPLQPSIQLVGPSTTFGNTKYLDAFVRAGGAQYLDALSVHAYSSRAASPTSLPEYSADIIDSAHWIRKVRGLAIPLWSTEAGWTTANAFSGDTDVLEAAYVARQLMLGWWWGVQRWFWYAWDYDGTNALHFVSASDHATLTAAGTAYKQVYSWMQGHKMTGLSVNGTVYTATFDTPSHAVWDTSGTSTFTIPPAWGATNVKDLGGGTTAINGALTWSIGVRPLLFV